MAKFSIKDSIAYGFQAFFKNLVLVVTAGLALGVVTWAARVAPIMTAKSLGVYREAPLKYQKSTKPTKAPIAKTSKTGIHAELHNVGTGIGESVVQKVRPYLDELSLFDIFTLLLVVLGISLLWLWIHIGAIRLVLDIRDKKKTSFQQLFSQKALLVPYVKLAVVYTLLIFCILLGVAVGGAILEVLLALVTSFFGVSESFAIIIAAGVALGTFFIFVMRYLFAFYIVVDKKKGPFEALAASYVLTQGNILKLSLFLFLLTLPFTFSTHFAMNNVINLKSLSVGLGLHIFFGLVGMLYALCFVAAYRQLGGKKA